ncbi:MAG: threo-3-hydroxy-L-aspartate ammonia-lyase [Cyanobacteria bacterium P01_A01_bin.135]
MPNPTADIVVSYADILAAAQRLDGQAHRTPVMQSRSFDQRAGAQVYFKCENLQRTGSFKFRGAYNAMSQLDAEARRRGVLTFSSGNHAQAIALSGQLLGIPTTIVMPEDAPQVKRQATEGYGAEVLLYDRSQITREALGQQLLAERGAVFIPPFDHPHVLAGQGTAVKELLEAVGELDLLLVCCGGGGLLSGSAIAAQQLCPTCRVVGVEPSAAEDGVRSFRSKTLQTVTNPDTIADGARTPSLGQLTFPIILSYVHDMVSVPDPAIIDTTRFLWERLKLVVEPTGALAAAALYSGRVKASGARVGVILSGGNVDIPAFVQRWK